MRAKLTKRTVDALTPPAAGRLYVYDTELPGFGLAVTPAGVRTFFAQYRTAGGRRGAARRVALGRYGPLTVDQGRAAAAGLLARAELGEDPAAERAADKQAPTVAELVESYLVMIRAKRKPATAAEYARQLARDVVPVLGKQRVAEVTGADVSALHLAMHDRPYLANRVLALLGGFFAWAEAHGHRAEGTNPTRRVEPYPEHARERFLSADELGRLGAALATAERVGLPPAPGKRRKAPADPAKARHRPKGADVPTPANPFAVACLRFLLLTGWREAEARELRWDAVDLGRGFAQLADTKTGRSARPLGAPALQLLAELPRYANARGVPCPYVFPAPTLDRPLATLTRLWDAVRHAAGLGDVRLHDLRHTAASVGAAGGLSLPLIGALLGHKRASTTQRYAHLADDPRRVAADRVAGEIAAALTPAASAPGDAVRVVPVVPIASRRPA